jgi:hypothetical protein
MSKNNPPPKKGSAMASAPTPRKSAEDELLEDFEELIDAAEKRLSHDEFMATTEKAKKALDRAIFAHSQRRGTA